MSVTMSPIQIKRSPKVEAENYYNIDDSQNLLTIQTPKTWTKRKVFVKPVMKPKRRTEIGIDKSNIINDLVVRTDVLARKRVERVKQRKQSQFLLRQRVRKRKVDISDKPDESIHCEICNKTYRNNLSFSLHSIKHNPDAKYSCHVCQYKTALRSKFEKHIKAHEGKVGFKCDLCSKTFTVGKYAAEHKYYHTGEKPFPCDICGKTFMYSRLLTAHRRSVHSETLTGMPSRKYDCLICVKQYSSPSGLKRHDQRYHTVGFDPSKICDICGKRLASKDKLKYHRRIHTGYKPYSCQVCAKSFTRNDLLHEHSRVHTGERPFICGYCNKGFTQRSALRIHVRLHTGETPYVCRICGRGFTSKGILEIHMRKCQILDDSD